MMNPTTPHGVAEPDDVRAVLRGVVELAKAAHAHWDADRDAKVGKILLALAGWNEGYDRRADALHAALATQPAPAEPVADLEFDDYPVFHEEAMGCGLEDRGITDRYEAMRYGWEEALERVEERITGFLENLFPAALASPAPSVGEPSKLQSSAPRRIYLDIGDQFVLERVLSGRLSWQSLEGVTWSEDNATSHGVEYVRSDLASPAPAVPASLTNIQIADLRAKHGVTSNGRGIREFEQVASFVRDAIALAAVGASKREIVDLLTSAAWQLKQHASDCNHVSSRELPGKLIAAATAIAATPHPAVAVPGSLTDAQIMDAVRHLAADGGRWPSDWVAAVRIGVALAASQPPGAATPKGGE